MHTDRTQRLNYLGRIYQLPFIHVTRGGKIETRMRSKACDRPQSLCPRSLSIYVSRLPWLLIRKVLLLATFQLDKTFGQPKFLGPFGTHKLSVCAAGAFTTVVPL